MDRRLKVIATMIAMALLTALSWGAAAPSQAAPARSNGTNKQVLFLHGYTNSAAVNCDDYWGNGYSKRYFDSYGWDMAQLAQLTYYAGGGSACTRFASASKNTPIDEIGRDFAWYVYNNYSSKGKAVDVVAHSMGGLVTRVAIAGTSKGRTTGTGRSFPPYLYIEDVVTLSTPHEGTRANIASLCPVVSTQCTQMKPGSSFLNSWILRPLPASNRVGYDNPQSQMGTDWSAVGSGDDWVVNTGSALTTTASYHFGHKYLYLSGSGLDHDKMSDIGTNGGKNYTMRYCDYTSSCSMTSWTYWTQTTTAAGPLWVAAHAVESQYW